MRETLIGAVDAGGSHTQIVLAAAGGERIIDVLGPSANPTKDGADNALGRVMVGVREALLQAGEAQGAETVPNLSVLAIGMAGVDSQERASQYQRMFGGLADRVIVMNDVEAQFGAVHGPGMVVAAGSGSAVAFRTGSGMYGGFGGNGLLADGGGGTWFARRVIEDVYESIEGINANDADYRWSEQPFAASIVGAVTRAVRAMPASKLQGVANPATFVMRTKVDLHGLLYEEPELADTFGYALHRAVVPVLFDLAELRDGQSLLIDNAGPDGQAVSVTGPVPEAREIVAHGAAKLSANMKAALRRHGECGTEIAVTGKIITNRAAYQNLIRQVVAVDFPTIPENFTIISEPIESTLAAARGLLENQ